MRTVRSIDVQGRRTRVLIDGQPEQPPILLLHGIGRSLEDWQPQYVALHRAGYRVIACDLPGSGLSERLSAATTVPGLAHATLQTLDAIEETRRLHVVGHSIGGAVALQLLALAPDRVATLTLVSSVGFGAETHPMLRLAATPVLGALATRYTSRRSAHLLERQLYVDRSLVTGERIDRAMMFARRPETGLVLHETARWCGSIRGIRPQWRNALLNRVSDHVRPTLIVWGQRDRILPAHHVGAARRHFPHARVHVFSGVGHLPQVEAAQAFTELTLDFLRSQPAACA
ncbi:alpha/beta fold hydrolase [Mycobacterium sherrisii]|uniref:Alpha/beta hydrolase n=1 Tax=Mycobacterium sherrisii TaxID=243061 RepID=A0A1E3SPN6_9MYCO|nr:alpha/beta fold hydrolase [Mycobacterium sherrisii]MCV7027978.1 alpha/beta fold hydrolase [Mycobacterium sherrisii]MEC4763495.1 alpha/beta fold hydrolase [Mycobacterium sherrisii]ODR04127.1 alpha/beta hydrolase [Mycobacterium sherrisii]ORW75960.1 alpha/beta hydrolase [Mycobacterium sherrisii]